MKTVHKYRLDTAGDIKALKLRQGYRIVRCEYLVPHKAVFLWVEEALSLDIPSCERHFRVVCSGHPIPENYRHVDTALDPFGPEAFHVYEVPAFEASRFEGREATGTQARGAEPESASSCAA